MIVTAAWNSEHDEAIIYWDYTHSHEMPTDAINNIMAMFYNQDLHPWFYVVADSLFRPLGLLITECVNLDLVEVLAIYNQIYELNQQIDLGEWGVSSYEV